MLASVGKVMKAAAAIVKGIAFDAHGSHSWIRDALMGQFESLRRKDLEGVEFFEDLSWKELPHHNLPRLPVSLCFHSGESIWALGGPCHLDIICDVCVFILFKTIVYSYLFIFIHIYSY